MSYHITFFLMFLNWTHFFLYYLHGIFLFWYDQACISLFRKKMRRIESKLDLSYFPLVNSFIFNVMNFVLISPTRFLFKTYFCMESYLKTFFFTVLLYFKFSRGDCLSDKLTRNKTFYESIPCNEERQRFE